MDTPEPATSHSSSGEPSDTLAAVTWPYYEFAEFPWPAELQGQYKDAIIAAAIQQYIEVPSLLPLPPFPPLPSVAPNHTSCAHCFHLGRPVTIFESLLPHRQPPLY